MSITSEKCIKIGLTAGNIRNGHVYLRDHLDFFRQDLPNGAPLGRAEFSLEFNGTSPVTTRIDESKAIFRWRGWGKLFKRSEVKEGDLVEFHRLGKAWYRVLIHTNKIWSGPQNHQPITEDRPTTPKVSAKRLQTTRSDSTRCNDLTGDEWLRCSLSVWSDIRKTAEEMGYNHPAMFPSALCERLISMFLRNKGRHRILDPFMGSGSTLVAARSLGKIGIGFEINPEYVALAKRRLDNPDIFAHKRPAPYHIYQCDARRIKEHVSDESIELCINSPPYWDILQQKRTADAKDIRHYGNLESDLGNIPDYHDFINQLARAYRQVYQVLKHGTYCITVVMDLRKKNRFFAYHSDIASMMQEIGFIYDDLIIWNRQSEYNNLRPLGYPAVFRINKIHEFILIFQKPKGPFTRKANAP